MRLNNKFLFGILLVFILLIGLGSAYMSSDSKFIESRTGVFQMDELMSFNTDMCQEGTDFVVQIPLLGCTPAVVRSDLLEEQDVPVFCELSAIKINPLVNIEAIDSINFAGSIYPPEVRTIGFHPSYSALGENRKLNNMMWDNIGYAVIWLRQQKNESALINCKKEGLSEICRVNGTLSAKIRYDLEGAFGLRRHSFYLPAMSDSEFSSRYGQYAFFDRKGFLRAENVDNTGASIVIYSGRNENLVGMSSSGQNDKQKVAQLNLDVGETSGDMFLPGFDCLATVKFRLDGIESPDARAKLLINSESIELKKGETFLENKCKVVDLEKIGLNQVVKLNCNDDERMGTFSLRITPSINLSVNGVSKNYKVGEKIFNTTEGKYVYLAYVSTKSVDGFETGNPLDLGAYLIAIPKNVPVLGDSELSQAANLFDSLTLEEGNFEDIASLFSGTISNFWYWMQAGSNFKYVHFNKGIKFDDKEIEILGFGEAGNVFLEEVSSEYYTSALSEYDLVSNSFSNEKYDDKTYQAEISLGERSLYGKINLANALHQKSDVRIFCEEFMGSYSETKLDLSICEDLEKMANTDISTKDVLIDGNWKRISFERIYEPSYEDYGIEINVRSKDGATNEDYKMKKDSTILLTDFIKENHVFMVESSLEVNVLHIKYSNGGWIWTPDNQNWMSVSKLIISVGESSGKSLSAKNQELFTSIKDTDFKTGSKILLRAQGTLDSIKLVEVHEDEAVLEFNLYNKSKIQTTYDFLGSKKNVLEKGVQVSFGSDYIFTLKKANIEQLAKVSVIPNINYAGSEVNFSFNIGVEKRAIQLSPEKAQNRVDKLNKTIEDWRKRSESLGDVVQTMKTACLGVGAALTVKNLIGGAGGKTIAREDVMYGSGGWYEECADKKIGDVTYSSEEDCLFKNADKIDAEVNQITAAINKQNSEIKQIQSPYTEEKLLGQNVVDTAKFIGDYSIKVNESLNWIKGADVYEGEKEIKTLDNVQKVLDGENWESGIYSVEQAKKIELYSELLKEDPENEAYKQRLLKALTDVGVNSEKHLALQNLQNNVVNSGLEKSIVRIYSGEGAKTEIYDGDVVPATDFGLMPVGKPIQSIYVDGSLHYVILNVTKENKYFIWKVYNESKLEVSKGKSDIIKSKYDYFQKYDSKSYHNAYAKDAEPKVKYYENDPYKGLPALVPFDRINGWYVYIKQTIPTGSTIRAYDDSGKVNSFWLCNVGQNGLEQFDNNLGDDICQMINLGTGQPYNQFPGLKTSEAKELVDDAQKAIYESSRLYGEGVKKATILNEQFEVGSPALDIPGIKCTDYMSPKDCKLLFNVCDPVICPNSRCDFGGAYPVPDVIQSGIIGSIALCLPNFNEGIYVPVCLTGVKAGIDGYLSIAQAYQDCLVHNLETGETIGVCDEIHSIYLCEFFWRQAFPLAKLAIPKLMGILTGQNSRGGGEYMGIEAAWENAKNSISYFTQFYATNSYKAFKARSTEEIGSAACGSFVSVAYPNGQGVLDVLTESDSPPQFNAKFDAIPFTTTTVPPINQYKVFYHIYAGNDRGAYFKVYLRGDPGGSYFQGTGFGKSVASGYIAKGEYASETVDFTAPEGYRELCVVVNDQEECGFAQVTSNFALDYIKDQYIKNQATNEDIKTEEECISGTPNVYSLLNPNIQEGVDSLIDPAIYEKGIIRICATDSPGSGSDVFDGKEGSRWEEVGYCGNEKMRCWIDTESIKDAVEFETTYNQSITELEGDVSEFLKDNNYMTPENFSLFLEKLKAEKDATKNIESINGIFEKIFMNNQNGYLHYLLGGFYGELANILHSKKVVDSKMSPSNLREKIIEYAELKVGKDCGEDCYASVKAIYDELGINAQCVYSISSSTELSQPLCSKCGCDKNEDGNCVNCPREQYELKSADLIQVYNANEVSSTGGHNFIFESWKDSKNYIANIFSQNYDTRLLEKKEYEISPIYRPVTVIWEPELKGYGESCNEGVEGTCLSTILDKDGCTTKFEPKFCEGPTHVQCCLAEEKDEFSDFEKSLDLVNPILELDNVCYNFLGGDWKWTKECDLAREGYKSIGYVGGVNIVQAKWLDTNVFKNPYGSDPTVNSKEIILLLESKKSFDEGLDLLINRAVDSRKVLSTSFVEMNRNKIFELTGFKDVEIVYFYYQNDAWYWSPDKLDSTEGGWILINEAGVRGGKISTNILGSIVNFASFDFFPDIDVTTLLLGEEDFIELFEKKDFKEGSKLLFFVNMDNLEDVIYGLGRNVVPKQDVVVGELITLEEAMKKILLLEGDYSDNKNKLLIDNMYKSGILSEEEYCDVAGKDINSKSAWSNTWNVEEDMDYVKEILIQKSLEKYNQKWIVSAILLKLNLIEKGNYFDNNVLINVWKDQGLLEEEEYAKIKENPSDDRIVYNLIKYFEGRKDLTYPAVSGESCVINPSKRNIKTTINYLESQEVDVSIVDKEVEQIYQREITREEGYNPQESTISKIERLEEERVDLTSIENKIDSIIVAERICIQENVFEEETVPEETILEEITISDKVKILQNYYQNSLKLSGKYSEGAIMDFVEDLKSERILYPVEYDDIRGVITRNEDMNYVQRLLAAKLAKIKAVSTYGKRTLSISERDSIFDNWIPSQDYLGSVPPAKCDMCKSGTFDSCSLEECYAISVFGGLDCAFYEGYFSNSCEKQNYFFGDLIVIEQEEVLVEEEEEIIQVGIAKVYQNELNIFQSFVDSNGFNFEEEFDNVVIKSNHFDKYTINNKNFVDLSGLSELTFLEELNLQNNKIMNLSPLRNLNNLIYLNVEKNCLQDENELNFYSQKLKESFLYGQNPRSDCEEEIEVCEIIPSLYEIIEDDGLSWNEKVADSTNYFLGKPVPNANKDNCFTSANAIYFAVGFGTTCKYSDLVGKNYQIRSNTIITKSSGIFVVNPSACSKAGGKIDLSQEEKLNLLKQGDMVDLVYGGHLQHTVIFNGWENKGNYDANLVDWNGGSSGNKIYREFSANLADDETPVYLIRGPSPLSS